MNHATRQRSSKGLLLGLFIAAIVAVLWLGWQFYTLNREMRRLHTHERLIELAGEIVHLDEVLTMSARMAAATIDSTWEDRYRRFEPQLDKAIKECLQLDPETAAKFVAQTDAANQRLVEMENRAFGFVRQKDPRAATAILFSSEYENQKRFYAEGIRNLTVSLRARADTSIKEQQRRIPFVLAAILALLTILSLFWLSQLRANRWRAETAERTRNELGIQVAAMTAHLTTANQRLEREMAARLSAHEDLRDREAFARSVLDAVGANVVVLDRHGVITEVNGAWKRFAGENGDASGGNATGVGANYLAVVRTAVAASVEGAAEALAGIQDVLDGRGPEFTVEYPCHSPDRPRWFMLRVTPLAGNAGGIVLAHTDITAQKQAEDALLKTVKDLADANRHLQDSHAQLLQSEKMASIGQLAAGVAHEINNPVGFVNSNLGTLTGYIDTFRKLLILHETFTAAVKAGKASEQARILAAIETLRKAEDLAFILKDVDQLLRESLDGTRRVKEIVHGLKSFARLDEAEVKEADLNEGIETTLKLIWNELKYKCTVHKKLGTVPMLRCHPSQLNQVFMNLLVNAAQAIPEKGDITIETGVADGRIFIRIADTGSGIAEEHLARLFTPFFTTKPVGKGTGLGLSISYGIVKKHNGEIQVESEVGKGTAFTIRLPLTGGPNEDAAAPSADRRETPAGKRPEPERRRSAAEIPGPTRIIDLRAKNV